MKKIINNYYLLILLTSLTLISCKEGSKSKTANNQTDSVATMEPVSLLAIGKILPAEGWKQITAEGSGVIEKIFVKEGDRLEAGSPIIQIRSSMNELDLSQSKVKLQELKEVQLQNKQDLLREQIALEQLYKKYSTSKILFEKQAETKEVTDADYSNWKQQEAKVNSLKKLLSSQMKAEEEQQIVITKSKEQVDNLQVKVENSGILTELLVKPGQFVNSSDAIGTYGNIDTLVIEAELDELYSDRVVVGQEVVFRKLGQMESIGSGKIIYVSPTLSDKSIIYETANEAQARRVRKLKISVENTTNLLINTKVDCLIKLN